MRLWKGLDGVRLRGSGRRVAWGLVAREGLSGSYGRINGSGGVSWKGDGGVGMAASAGGGVSDGSD